MKKIFLIVLFFAIVTQYGFSQFFVGGDLSYQYDTTSRIKNNSENSQSNLTISPLVGYRFDKADVGLLFSYQSSTYSNAITYSSYSYSSYSNDQRNVGFGVFGSYNIFSVDRFSILGRATARYINTKMQETAYSFSTDSNSVVERNYNTFQVGISPIFEYKLFEHFSLYSSIGIISFSCSWGDDINKQYSFGSSLSSSIGLGFYIYF